MQIYLPIAEMSVDVFLLLGLGGWLLAALMVFLVPKALQRLG